MTIACGLRHLLAKEMETPAPAQYLLLQRMVSSLQAGRNCLFLGGGGGGGGGCRNSHQIVHLFNQKINFIYPFQTKLRKYIPYNIPEEICIKP